MNDLDPVWKALSSPWRRQMLDLLSDKERTTGDLAGDFPTLSRFAVMQHLKVLEQANLVVVRREGRLRYNYLNPVPIQQIYERWVNRFERHWAGVMVALKREVEERDPAEQQQAS